MRVKDQMPYVKPEHYELLKDADQAQVIENQAPIRVPNEGVLIVTEKYGRNTVELFCDKGRYHWRSSTKDGYRLRSVEKFSTKEKALKDMHECFR